MKLLLLLTAAAALALSSCAELAGTSLTFDSDGNATFQAAPRVVVIPAK